MTKTLVMGITLLGCLALSVNLHAQGGGDVEQQIKQLQQQATDAQMKNDVSWAEQHLADGFLAGHSWGVWQTKADFIKDLQNKTNKWKSGNISDLHVATFGSNTAVAHYKFTYDADITGTHRARSVICSARAFARRLGAASGKTGQRSDHRLWRGNDLSTISCHDIPSGIRRSSLLLACSTASAVVDS